MDKGSKLTEKRSNANFG